MTVSVVGDSLWAKRSTGLNEGVPNYSWSPLDMRPIAYYRADSGIVFDSGVQVKQWRDSSPNGWYMEQTVPGDQPDLINVTAGGRTVKGVQFVKASTEFMRAFEARSPGSSEITVYAIARLDIADSGGQFFDVGNDAGAVFVGAYPRSVLGCYAQLGESVDSIGRSGEIHLLLLTAGLSGSKYFNSYIDNYSVFTTSAPVDNLLTSDAPTMGAVWNLSVPGAFQYSDCTILEAGYYNRAISQTERARLNDYARVRYYTTDTAPWSPKDLAPAMWCRSDAGITTTSSRVSGWADISGNGWNFEQTVSGNRPVMTNAFGFNAVHFTSANTECLQSFESRAFTNAEGFFWVVCSAGSVGSPDPQVIFSRLESSGMEIYTDPSSNLGFRIDAQNVEDTTSINGVLLAASAEYSVSGNTFFGFKNNTQVASGTDTLGSASSKLTVGARLTTGTLSNGASVDVFECGFVPRTLTVPEKAKLQTYFNKRYGI
jgi:hypothetical protein